MIEPAIVVVRLLQYVGAAILMGSSLFFAWTVPGPLPAALARRARALSSVAAALLALSSLLAIALQGSLFGGSLTDGFALDTFATILSSMDLGKAAAARAVVAALAFALSLALPAGRTGNAIAAGLGTPAVASLAWMGHAAGSGNRLHLASDIVHALAASLWIGALAGFVLLLVSERALADTRRLHAALERFSAVGVAMVLALALSGLANAWYVIGLDHIGQSLSRPYGKLLLAKLAAFAGMVVLAAINRYRLTPALEAQPDAATLARLRRSIGLEATLGFTTLALVAWLGTLEPFG